MTKRILITGGSGFLGSHLCDCMIDAGHQVLCLDNFFTGRREGDCIGPMNIGNSNEFTVKALAETVIEVTGNSSKLINLPLPADDPQQRQPVITLAKTHLDWEPKVQLRDGLAKTIEYFESLQS